MSVEGHLQWGAEALWEQLEPLLPGLSVEVVARAGSTNTCLLERARGAAGRRAGDVHPSLLVAEHQTEGRGRLGRNWRAAPGVSLTFSLALPLAPADWSGLSLAVGLALADALDTADPPRVMLKWPNDLWIGNGPGQGRKLGGILIETVSGGSRRMCVVGVGLNVLPFQTPVDGLAHGHACVQELHAAATAPGVLALVAVPLVRALLAFERNGFAPLAAAYARRDLLLGQSVTTSQPGVPQGTAEGVDAKGALRVRRATLHAVVSGEVSVRLATEG